MAVAPQQPTELGGAHLLESYHSPSSEQAS